MKPFKPLCNKVKPFKPLGNKVKKPKAKLSKSAKIHKYLRDARNATKN